MGYSWFEALRQAVLVGDLGLSHALVAAVRPLAGAVVHLPEGDLSAHELVDYASLMAEMGQRAVAEGLLRDLLR